MSKLNNWNSVPQRARFLFSAECANKVLPIHERNFSHDNRPRKAVEAAFEYGLTSKPISQNIIDDIDETYDEALAIYNNFPYNQRNDDDYIDDAESIFKAISIINASTYGIVTHVFHKKILNFDSLKEKVIGKIEFDPNWKTTHTLGIAKKIWETRQLGNLPILADALIDAGCDMDLVNYMISDNEQTLADFFLWNLNLE